MAATTVSVEKNLRASVTDMVPEVMMMEMIDVMIEVIKTMMVMAQMQMMMIMMTRNANKTTRFDIAY